jgi:hypothetical protein
MAEFAEMHQQQHEWIAAERGWSAGSRAVAQQRRHDRALAYRWHVLRHHREYFTRPTAPPPCHLHR